MTSLTFIFGVFPLVISKRAGAASRHSVGVGVMGGMIAATTLALFFVPLFFQTPLQGEKRVKKIFSCLLSPLFLHALSALRGP